MVPQLSEICEYILNSDLMTSMESGLSVLDPADKPELQQRYMETYNHYQSVKSSIISIKNGTYVSSQSVHWASVYKINHYV